MPREPEDDDNELGQDPDDDVVVADLDHDLAADVGPLVVGPDGGFVPTPPVGHPFPIPAATTETLICLRGCRHYLELKSGFLAGNTMDSLDKPPIQINRYCLVHPGGIDLVDETVLDCNRWHPEDPTLVSERNLARKQWSEANEVPAEAVIDSGVTP